MKEVREIKEKIAFQFVSQILDQTFMLQLLFLILTKRVLWYGIAIVVHEPIIYFVVSVNESRERRY